MLGDDTKREDMLLLGLLVILSLDKPFNDIAGGHALFVALAIFLVVDATIGM